MEFITSEELASSNDQNILVVDIRDEDTYKMGHVKDSFQVDVYGDIKMGNRDVVKERLSSLPKDKTIITVCNVGMTAQKATAILEDMGYKSKVLEGGMMKWAETQPVEIDYF